MNENNSYNGKYRNKYRRQWTYTPYTYYHAVIADTIVALLDIYFFLTISVTFSNFSISCTGAHCDHCDVTHNSLSQSIIQVFDWMARNLGPATNTGNVRGRIDWSLLILSDRPFNIAFPSLHSEDYHIYIFQSLCDMIMKTVMEHNREHKTNIWRRTIRQMTTYIQLVTHINRKTKPI